MRRSITVLMFTVLMWLLPAPPLHAWDRDGMGLPSTAVESSGIVSVARSPDQVDVFWIRADGAVATAHWSDGRGVWDPQLAAPSGSASTGSLSGGLAVVARNPSHLDVFWIRPDGAVASSWWDASTRRWATPFTIAPARDALPGTLAAVARNPDQLDVFWIGPDRAIGTTAWNPQHGWLHPWPITAPAAARYPAGALSVLSRTRDQLDLFWVRPDGGVSTAWWNAQANWPSRSIAPAGHVLIGDRTTPQRAALTAVSRRPDQIDVFWIGPDGGIGTTAWNPRLNWPAPWPIAPPRAALPGALSAAARTGARLELVWISPQNRLQTLSFDEGIPGGWSGLVASAPGSTLPGAVNLISRKPGRLDAFWVRPDRTVGTDWWNPEHVRVHIRLVDLPHADLVKARYDGERVAQVFRQTELEVTTVSVEQMTHSDAKASYNVGACDRNEATDNGPLTADQTDLLRDRPNVPATDIVLYVVDFLAPAHTTGCANYIPGRPAAIVSLDAGPLDWAHEVAHVLGLEHVNDKANLMYPDDSRSSTPVLTAQQKTTIYQSPLSLP